MLLIYCNYNYMQNLMLKENKIIIKYLISSPKYNMKYFKFQVQNMHHIIYFIRNIRIFLINYYL